MADVPALVTRAKKILSRRNDTSLDADILDELKGAQDRLENGPTLPYQLQVIENVLASGAHESFALPSGFIRFAEEEVTVPLRVFDPDADASSEQYAEMIVEDFDKMISRGLGSGTGIPEYAAIVGLTAYVRARQAVDRTYRLVFYKKAAVLTASGGGATNVWTTYWGDLLMADAGIIVAQLKRDLGAQKIFSELRASEYRKLVVAQAAFIASQGSKSMGD